MEKLCKVLEMELKMYKPVDLKLIFEKVRLARLKDLLLVILSSNIVTHSNGYRKSDRYFFFHKSSCSKSSPENKLFTKKSTDTIQKHHTYHTKQYQTFYRKVKCDLVNFRGVQNGYHQDFNI